VARVGVPLVEVLRLPGFSLDDLPPDAPEHEVAEGHQSRLGKGLSAIMPSTDATAPRRRAGGVASVIPLGPLPDDAPNAAAPVPPEPALDHPSQLRAPLAAVPALALTADDLPALAPEAEQLVDRLHGDLVTALLDGLAAAGSPDLVAYVHQPDRGTPRLHLGRPALEVLTPDGCFQISRALDVLARTRPGLAEPFAAAGFDGIGVVVAGVGARGLWVAARQGAPLGPDEVEATVAYARGTGAAATLVDRRGSAVGPLPEVQVRVDDGQVQAQVQLPHGSGEAGAPTGVEAAARAALAASGSDAEFLYAAAARDGATAASIVLVRSDSRVGVGSAAGAGDAPALTATAALRATQHRTTT
jgi:hypothetical protein